MGLFFGFKVRPSLLALAFAGLASAAAHAAPPAISPSPGVFAEGIAVVKAYRVFTRADGESDVEPADIKAVEAAYFKPGNIFRQIDLGPASKVRIVSGPPNAEIPPHMSLGKEMFLTLHGASTIILHSGHEIEMRPGTLVLFDDAASKTPRAGRVGSEGYVALQIIPPQAPAAR